MKFTICMTTSFVSKEKAIKYKKYGFEFKKDEHIGECLMKSTNNPIVEFNTIEELVSFSIDIDELIILNGNNLEIYNDYRE